MGRFLCIEVQFLDETFHGRGDGGEPEWPPSPLRLFQAIVESASTRWRGQDFSKFAEPVLHWLENQPGPLIIAPTAIRGEKHRLYVPDNVMDKVARSWTLGNAASIADYRTEKDVCPLHLREGNVVRYLWALDEVSTSELQEELLAVAVRSVTHLGWGIDMVVANAHILSDAEVCQFKEHRWRIISGEGNALRIPKSGTLTALQERHQKFLQRLPSADTFRPVPSLSTFNKANYHSDTAVSADRPRNPPIAAFSLLQPDGSAYRPFDTARRATVVAGMVRHALATAANVQRPFGWSDDQICEIVQGHSAEGGPAQLTQGAKRFAYLPLPSIEHRKNVDSRHVGMIRRVIVAGKPGMEQELAWVRRALAGIELIDEQTGKVVALLSQIPACEWNVQQFTSPQSTWATVTPVVIPGFDDGRDAKAERLLRKAIEQAGISSELAQHAELDFRNVGFFPGVDLASRYRRPRNASEAPVRHVKINWRDQHGKPIKLSGPLAIGSGRFRGLGLFAGFK